MNIKMVTPSERLRATRINAGYKTVKMFCQATQYTQTPISYNRMLNLEQRSLPTPLELNTLREILATSADYLLCGYCNKLCDEINIEAEYLDDAQTHLLLQLALANAKIIRDEMHKELNR